MRLLPTRLSLIMIAVLGPLVSPRLAVAQGLLSSDTVPGSGRAGGRLMLSLIRSLSDSGTGVLARHPLSVARSSSGDLYFVSWRLEPVRVRPSGQVELLDTAAVSGVPTLRVFAVRTSGQAVDFFDIPRKRRLRVNASSEGARPSQLQASPFEFQPFGGIVDVRGRRYVSGLSRTQDRIGYPLHEVDSAGSIVRSFGSEHAVGPRSETWALRTALAETATGDGFWLLYQQKFIAERYDALGELQQRIVRIAPWFDATTPYSSGDPTTPPSPVVLDIQENSAGQLIVLTRVADSSWSHGFARSAPIFNEAPFDVQDYDRAFDTIIEVIDPGTRHVIHTERIDRYFFGFLQGGYILRYSTTPESEPRLEIWSFSFAEGRD